MPPRRVSAVSRLPTLLAAIGLLVGAASGVAAQHAAREFPYRAAVAEAAAEVFAGPGPHYYTTAELPRGATVEVYEHNAGGFCAVRPPEGSFSWVPAADLNRMDGDVAEVTRAGVPARVGSLLHSRRDAVHVRLEMGERVRVLSEAEIDGVRWSQIAPPAGEFRWVRRDALTTDVPDQPPAAGGDATPAEAQQSVEGGPASPDRLGWVRAAGHDEQTEPAPAPADDTSTPPATSGADAQTPIPSSTTGTFAERLNAIEVALARQIAERPTLWKLERLEADASGLMLACSNEQQRAAVRSLAGRLDYFAAVANRYKNTRGLAPEVAATKAVAPAGEAPGAPLTPLTTPAPPTAGYDAVGVLRPVVSKRPGAPQFALVDAQGKIVSFVTPSPELTLSPLVGTRVGVEGMRGYMPEYGTPHLTARRATTLDAPIRR